MTRSENIMRQALIDITQPLAYFQRRSIEDGCVINGDAITLARDYGTLQSIAQHALDQITLEESPREDERDVARLREALRWALPLAERAVDDHRLERLRCGHSAISGTYANGVTWAGIHQSEVDQIEYARAALAMSPAGTDEGSAS